DADGGARVGEGEVFLRVEAREGLGVPGVDEVADGGGRGLAGVVPALEGDDHVRGVEVRETVDLHRSSLERLPGDVHRAGAEEWGNRPQVAGRCERVATDVGGPGSPVTSAGIAQDARLRARRRQVRRRANFKPDHTASTAATL